jgi:uncharacterized sulfatase
MVFSGCIAQANWTRPSVATILSGTYLNTHGVIQNSDVLSAAMPSLPVLLRANGYLTAFVVANPQAGEGTNLTRGAEFLQMVNPFSGSFFEEPQPSAEAKFQSNEKWMSLTYAERPDLTAASSRAANDWVFRWLDQHQDEPFFLYIHTMGAHAPYIPPSPYCDLFPNSLSPSRRKYDQLIRYSDDCFGDLVEKLERLGIANKTIVVFASDHGEGFSEHSGSRFHGTSYYEEQLEVPLVIRYPGSPLWTQKCGARVGLVDLFPTICEMLKIAPPMSCKAAAWSRFGMGARQIPTATSSVATSEMRGRSHFSTEITSFSGRVLEKRSYLI